MFSNWVPVYWQACACIIPESMKIPTSAREGVNKGADYHKETQSAIWPFGELSKRLSVTMRIFFQMKNLLLWVRVLNQLFKLKSINRCGRIEQWLHGSKMNSYCQLHGWQSVIAQLAMSTVKHLLCCHMCKVHGRSLLFVGNKIIWHGALPGHALDGFTQKEPYFEKWPKQC